MRPQMAKSYFQLNPIDVPNSGISNANYNIAQATANTPICGNPGARRLLET